MAFLTPNFNYQQLGQTCLQSIILVCLSLSVISPSISQAKDLYITNDYLKGLDDEISSPDYIKKAKQELEETEKLEQSQSSTSTEIQHALASMYNFETLIRTKYPSSHVVYSKLPVSARILIFNKFKNTKKLSSAKRMIIEKYETK